MERSLALTVLLTLLALLLAPLAAAGPLFGADVLMNPPDDQPELDSTIAVNPLNPLNLVAGSKVYGYTRFRRAAVYVSTDGGRTWSAALVPGMEQYNASSNPVVAFDRRGNAYYAALAFNECCSAQQAPAAALPPGSAPAMAANSGIYVHRSPAQLVNGKLVAGLSWTQHVRLPDPHAGSAWIHDRPWLAVGRDPVVAGRDNLYLSETLFDTYGRPGIWFQRSTDGGLTWSNALRLTGANESVQGSVVATDPRTGAVYVAWYDYLREAQRLRRSIDGGLTFEPAQTVAAVSVLPSPLPGERFRTNSFPALAVTPCGNIYLVWADYRRGNADIYAQRSRDGGRIWQGPVRINDDAGTHHQFLPAIGVNAAGKLAVSWYDNRDDPANHQYTIYAAIAEDGSGALDALFGGAARIANTRVGDQLNDPNVGISVAGNIGDYMGVAVGPTGVVHPMWMGTWRGNQDVFTDAGR
jgi:hypothetical protein